MRTRSLAFLSTVAVATLALAGCAGQPAPESSSTPEPESQCLIDAKPGEGSDAVVIVGEGADAKVTIPEGTAFADIERTVVAEGEGEDAALGDLLSVRYQLVDATNNTVLDSSERGPDGVLPVLLEPQQSSLFVAALECLPVGSTVVLALPSSALGEGSNDIVVFAEAVEELPVVAMGDEVDPVEGMPTVELDDDGAPQITIPEGEPPAETEVAVLKQGDGATVGEGDLVVVQYRGVKWSDGKEFDSSWSRGAPSQFPTSGVVNGFRLALEGQQVGSQVIVVMTPEDGYGSNAGHELEKETLVFVVDILGTTAMQ